MSGVAGFERKWGEGVVDAGFTMVPNHLLAANAFLPAEQRISSTEMMLLLQLLSSWWNAGEMPFPSKATLARRVGLKSTRQVQRALKTLEDRGLIERKVRYTELSGRASNYYDLQGLVSFVQEIVARDPRALKGRTRTRVASAE